jgi:intein/homing endonuclease
LPIKPNKVLAKDAETGEMAYKEVEWLFQRDVEETYNITVGGEVITTTDEHPFWIVGKSWVKSKDLEVADVLTTSDGKELTIEKIEIKKEHRTVYNFKVKDFHNYFVEQQFNALIESVKATRELGFYILEVEAEPDPFILPNENEIYHPAYWVNDSLISFNEYRDLTLVLDNTVFSKQGEWGVIISNEGHAVLGGTMEFISYFKQLHSKWADCFNDFEKMCEYNRNNYNSNLDWYESFTKHLID